MDQAHQIVIIAVFYWMDGVWADEFEGNEYIGGRVVKSSGISIHWQSQGMLIYKSSKRSDVIVIKTFSLLTHSLASTPSFRRYLLCNFVGNLF